MVVKRAAGPLTAYIRDREREKIAGDDVFFIALRTIQEEQEKEAGLSAAIAHGMKFLGKGLSGAGRATGSAGLLRAGGRASKGASKRFGQLGSQAEGRAISALGGGKRYGGATAELTRADKYTALAGQTSQAAKQSGQQAGKLMAKPKPLPPTGAPVAEGAAGALGHKLLGGALLAGGVGTAGYGTYKGIQHAGRQNAARASQGYNFGVR